MLFLAKVSFAPVLAVWLSLHLNSGRASCYRKGGSFEVRCKEDDVLDEEPVGGCYQWSAVREIGIL